LAALRKPLLPEELPPKDRELVLQAGKAAWAIGARRAQEAETILKELAARYPDASNVNYLLGSLLLISDPKQGIPHLQRELAISPGHLPALVQLALEFEKQGDKAQALVYAREAAKVAPKSFAARNTLGRMLVDSGELEEGIKELEAARALAPDSPQTRIALASAYSKAGRKEEAARERQEFKRLWKQSDDRSRPQ
jgi:predicted Zn-dependent protease